LIELKITGYNIVSYVISLVTPFAEEGKTRANKQRIHLPLLSNLEKGIVLK